jgi:prepilin-type N-terminal cleavage/methylation domain-containing protein/prepilin-type processing-associated H-X9-DG protein
VKTEKRDNQRAATTSLRPGYTLIEMLVTIGIVAIVAGLLLPAVQSSREAARRARCLANLRELITAVQSDASAYGAFPNAAAIREFGPGRSGTNITSLLVTLLPFMEQNAIYDAINLNITMTSFLNLPTANETAASLSVGAYLCPSDPLATAMPYGPASYRANVGLGGAHYTTIRGPTGLLALTIEDNGAFTTHGEPTPLSSFTDGLSNTIAFAEKKIGSGPSAADPSRDWIEVPYDGEVSVSDWIATCSNLRYPLRFQQDGGRMWLFYGTIYTNFYCSVPPNSAVPDCGNPSVNGWGVFAARSYHPGGVNAALADGSVRWFPSTIDQAVWRSLGTRNGGEAILPEY